MALANGTYVIRSVYDTNLVIDSAFATDRSGANVQFCSWNASDAQYVCAYDLGGGTYRLMFPATGKAIDISGGIIAQGRNVQQYAWNGTDAQKWKIQETGETKSFSGKSYPVYKIRVAASTSWVLEGNEPAFAQSGTNICIAADEGTSNDQKWIFVPANPMPTGTYEIVSALSPSKCLDVSGASTGHGARVIIQDRNGGNNQKIWIQTYGDNGRSKMIWVHSMKALACVNTNAAAVDDDVCQDIDRGETDQRWILEPRGVLTVDGSVFQSFQISNFATEGETLCIDVANGATANGSRVRLYPMNGSPAELFAFVPTEALKTDLPTPANVGFVVNGSVVMSGAVVHATPRLYFECSGDKFSARFRYRAGRASSSGIVWDSWGAWRSTYDSGTQNSGWGDAWKPNVIFSSSPNAKSTGTLSIPSISGSVSAVQIQGEVRSFVSGYNGNDGLYAHGNTGASQTVTLAKKPTLALSAPRISKNGIEVPYSSDWTAGGCTLAVSALSIAGLKSLSSTRRTTGLNGASGTVTIGWAQLLECPSAGGACSATAVLETGLLNSNSASASGTLSTVGTTRQISPTYSESDHGTWILTPDTNGSARAFVRYDGKVVEATRLADGTFDLMVPLNTECSVTVVEVDSNGTWGFKDIALPAIDSKCFVWGFGDNDWAVLDLGIGQGPVQESKRERNHESYVTTGRAFPATRFVQGGSRDMSCSGVVVDSLPGHGTVDAFERLLEAGHATFRNPRGEVVTVAVTAISDPIENRKYTTISVEQHQETR